MTNTSLTTLAARLRNLEDRLTPLNDGERAALDTLAINGEERETLLEVADFLEAAANVVVTLQRQRMEGV